MVRCTGWAFSDNFNSLEEWLELIFSGNEKIFPSNHFPSEGMLEEYLSTIHKIEENEVINLIRKFLVYSGFFGGDESKLKSYNLLRDSNDEICQNMYIEMSKSEYYRRLSNGEYAWEGITWILDLLPHYPQKAIDAISSYLFAHFYCIPDSSIYGLEDTMALIRGRFIEMEHQRELFLKLRPEQFEWLIDELYEKMGYETQLTPHRKDGGIDVIAERYELGKKEKVLIQCKRYNKKVGVETIRQLLWLVTDRKANKGVVICCSKFTKGAIKEKASLELIGYKELNQLLNAFMGAYWHTRLDRIIIAKELKAHNKVKK
jgi:restriction system protein